MARIAYVDVKNAAPDVAPLLARIQQADGTVPNIFRALGNSPSTLRNFMRLGTSILRHLKLNPRLRELAILRVASLTGSTYEWAHHVPIAREAGVSEEALHQIGRWRQSYAFDAEESAVLALAEASTLDLDIPEEVFRRVREFLDEEQVVELLMTVGYYNLVSRLLVGLKVDVEPGYQQWSLPPDDLRLGRR